MIWIASLRASQNTLHSIEKEIILPWCKVPPSAIVLVVVVVVVLVVEVVVLSLLCDCLYFLENLPNDKLSFVINL